MDKFVIVVDGAYLLDGLDGDPGRTLLLAKATRYRSRSDVRAAIEKAEQTHPCQARRYSVRRCGFCDSCGRLSDSLELVSDASDSGESDVLCPTCR